MQIILYNKENKQLDIIDPHNVIDGLYYLKYKLPNEVNIKEHMSKHKNDTITNFFINNIDEGINKIKNTISLISDKIPLFDAVSENLYIIHKSLVYDKVFKENYRFPDEEILKNITQDIKEMTKDVRQIEKTINTTKKKISMDIFDKYNKLNYQKYSSDILKLRKFRKLTLILKFMKSFNIEILYDTYIKTLYFNADQLGKNLTICKRPSYISYLTHITPYYAKNEIINMALNIGIINPNDDLKNVDINKLCKRVSANDISNTVLTEHQNYMLQNKMVGLVQYYSMQGSYFMNQYLRSQVSYNYKNNYLEQLITSMWKLLENAPKFDKSYTLYRFVQTDDFVSHLKIGDTYTEEGFMSTTRDPFYKDNNYGFGSVLFKIKIPANIQGVALCIETISHFPKEQEIILAPLSRFKLINKDNKCVYYHTNQKFGEKIKTRYEFEYIGKGNIKFPEREPYTGNDEPIDFLTIKKINSLTINEKINWFLMNYVNPMYQFDVLIGDKKITIQTEWCDSTNVYKNFYALNIKDGFIMYSLFNHHMLFIIELGEKEHIPCLFVNYYIKYTTLDINQVLGIENFTTFIASIAYYFEIPTVVLYNDYISCDYVDKNKIFDSKNGNMCGTYCVDFYNYLKNGKKKFLDVGVLCTEINPEFKYFKLDTLSSINPSQIIIKKNMREEDKDEIYQIYEKIYKNIIDPINDNLSSFYIWMVENHCPLLEKLINKMSMIEHFSTENPFVFDYYIFDAISYLYNRKLVNSYPKFMLTSNITSRIIKHKNAYKNKYRLTNQSQRL